MSRRRTLAVSGGVLAAVLLLMLSSVAWIVGTESGSRWAVDRARAHLPETIRFGAFSGVLAGPFTVEDIRVETAAATVRVARLDVDWAPGRLVWSEVHVSRLDVRNVDVVLQGGGETDAGEAFALPDKLPVPFAVVVEQLEIRDTRVESAGGDVHRVDRVALRFAAGPQRISVEGIDIAAPLVSASGDVRLGAAAPFDLGGEIRWRVRVPEPRLATLAGTLKLGGNLRRARVRVHTREPEAATLQLSVRAFRKRPTWSGSLQMPRTRLDSWWSEAPPWTVAADLGLDGSFEAIRVVGRTEVEGLPPGPLSADVDLHASMSELVIERLRVTPARRPESFVAARGRLEFSDATPRFDVNVNWDGVAWPLEGEPILEDATGSLHLAGVPEDYRIEAETGLRTPRTGTERVTARLEASGSTEALTRLDAGLRWHEARLDAAGSVRWAPVGRTQLSLRLRNLDPGKLVADLDGDIAATADLEAAWGERLEATLNLSSLEGELNGRPVSGSARVRRLGAVTEIDSLRLRAGEAELSASGRAAESVEVRWNLAVPDLGQLVPDWDGRIEARGRLNGTAEQPVFGISALATSVAAPMFAVDSLSVEGRIAPLGGRTDLVVEAKALASDAVNLDTFSLAARGTPDDHRLDATTTGARGRADVSLTGGLQGPRWSGRISEATLAPTDLPAWSLEESAAMLVEGNELVLERTCWRSGEARFCGAFSGGAAAWRTRLDAERVPIEPVASLLRDDLEYRGTFGLDVRLSSDGGPVIGEARLNLQPGSVAGVIEDEPETLLDFRASEVVAVLSREAVHVEGDLRLADDGRVRVDARVGRPAPHALSGRVRARVANLGLVTVLTPVIGRMEGTFLADLQLAGSVADPSLAGSAKLDSGLMGVVPLGIELTDIEADLATANRGMDVTVRARSGEGRIEADTRIAREDGSWVGEGTISGRQFEAVSLPEATVIVTPDLEWRIAGRAVTVAGNVAVPGARIEPRDLSNAVQTSPDTVIVGSAGEAVAGESPPLQVTANVNVTLGDDVHVDAFGLKGRLEGRIEVTERPDQVTRAIGEMRVVGGSYSIYAQTLQIERGRLLFDGGPAANPALDVRAVRRSRDVVVGVNVRGRLREPLVTLFSEPPMEESEQLSYLLFGIPLNQTSEGQQANLAFAAAALASSEQGSRVVGRFGIQEVTVDNGAPGEGASLVLGRYLSPRLYVGYGIGLMEQANSVRVRYDLTRHWTVEARSGATSSADLLYHIEVDSTADALKGVIENNQGENSPPLAPEER